MKQKVMHFQDGGLNGTATIQTQKPNKLSTTTVFTSDLIEQHLVQLIYNGQHYFFCMDRHLLVCLEQLNSSHVVNVQKPNEHLNQTIYINSKKYVMQTDSFHQHLDQKILFIHPLQDIKESSDN